MPQLTYTLPPLVTLPWTLQMALFQFTLASLKGLPRLEGELVFWHGSSSTLHRGGSHSTEALASGEPLPVSKFLEGLLLAGS